MYFRVVSSKIDFTKQEHEILEFWKQVSAFSKLRELRSTSPRWSFLDGPITANNPMGVHHAWGRTNKDLLQRFKAMQGFQQRWQNGFDCQGLWVEVNVEKELGFSSKRDIDRIGVAEFVKLCKQRVLTYSAKMTEQSIRLGMWMEWNDPAFLLWLREKLGQDPMQVITVQGANSQIQGTVEEIVGQLGTPELGGSYFTFSDENNYMIWTFLKTCWERGWIYKGRDVMPWCPRCGTGISQHEIATEGYKELTHRSVYVRFQLTRQEKHALLVWTTTPWTLPANVAVAVHPEITYIEIKQGDWTYYVAEGAVGVIKGDYQPISQFKGKEMIGWKYIGPFDELSIVKQQEVPSAHIVIPWEEVTPEEGTGIVHIAPGAGAEDFALGKGFKLPVISPLDESGVFISGFDSFTGLFAGDASKLAVSELDKKGLLYELHDYSHRYPVCWRCGEELLFRLVDEWFISMGHVYGKPRTEVTHREKERSLRYQIMDMAERIKWVPSYGLSHELDWLINMGDWMISKKRYWGLALPIWECRECGNFELVGNREELKSRAIEGWEMFSGHTPHRPWVDAIKLKCSSCGGTMNRVPDVGNPWLDAGIVAYSTLRYRQDKRYWEDWFPVDLITEPLPQQHRNWFYALLTMSTVLEAREPTKNIYAHQIVLGEDGQPMHKSWGNYIDFDEVAEKAGIDTMRWMYLRHHPETDLLFGYKAIREAERRMLTPLWNVYSFFTIYASIDKWAPIDHAALLWEHIGYLDRWILSRLNEMTILVTQKLNEFQLRSAALLLEDFAEDLTNWYLRRSRRRFWKSENDVDKDLAYSTLYSILIRLTKLLAPFMPFVTEAIYQNLVRASDTSAPESVHHCSWPTGDDTKIDKQLLLDMEQVRKIVKLGHAARDSAKIKVRQPLAKAIVLGWSEEKLNKFGELVSSELNVKSLLFSSDINEFITYQLVLDLGKLGPRLGEKLPKFQEMLETTDSTELASTIQSGRIVHLQIDGQEMNLSPDEVSVRMIARDGYSVAVEGNTILVLYTRLTEPLLEEGIARDVVRRIQDLRRQANLEIDERIEIVYSGSQRLVHAIGNFADYIKQETLSLNLIPGNPESRTSWKARYQIDGQEIYVGILRRHNN